MYIGRLLGCQCAAARSLCDLYFYVHGRAAIFGRSHDSV